MHLPHNSFKRALRGPRPLIGFWSSLASTASTEVLGDAGLDWILIDTEHAPNELPAVADHLRALLPTSTAPIVRPAWNDPVLIKRILDVGAQTLLVPYVQSAVEAQRAVAATRFPPDGVRGVAAVHRSNRYGRVKDYFAHAGEEICVVVQLETGVALDALEAIAGIDGVDALFIGPSDLAANLGHIGDAAHPAVRGAVEDACKRARAVGIPIGILAPIEADARAYLAMGFQFVAVGSDVVTLRQGVDRLVQAFRSPVD
jgi:4-hydroxy-2-oxoheptanedioate aldolase